MATTGGGNSFYTDNPNWPLGPDGQPLSPEQVAALGLNVSGASSGQREALWKGGQRSDQWQPVDYLQSYGNYTGMFPSQGQQVGQALHGSIQSERQLPSWYQSAMPQQQSANRTQDMGLYNHLLYSTPDPIRGGYTPNQNRFQQVKNQSPLNILQDQRTIGKVSAASNPFIGAYQGLTGWPGNGPPTTQPPQTQPPQTPQQPPQQPPYQPPQTPGTTPPVIQPTASPRATATGGELPPEVYQRQTPGTPMTPLPAPTQPDPMGGYGGSPYTGIVNRGGPVAPDPWSSRSPAGPAMTPQTGAPPNQYAPTGRQQGGMTPQPTTDPYAAPSRGGYGGYAPPPPPQSYQQPQQQYQQPQARQQQSMPQQYPAQGQQQQYPQQQYQQQQGQQGGGLLGLLQGMGITQQSLMQMAPQLQGLLGGFQSRGRS